MTYDAFEADSAKRPAWPVVVGVISIVWGVVSLACVAMSGVGVAFQGSLIEPMLEGAPMPEAHVTTSLDWAMIGISLLTTLFLLFGGILCVMRSPISRFLILFWAITAIPLSLFGYTMQMENQQSLREWAEQYPNNKYAESIQQSAQMSDVTEMVGLVITVIFGVLIPGFFLVWFGLIKNKAHHMTGVTEPEFSDL